MTHLKLAAAGLVALIAAALPVAAGAALPGLPERDVQVVRKLTVYDWLRVLPAPTTPHGWVRPSPQFTAPVSGYVLTQPFGCTGFDLEKPATGCPGGFHTGLDLAVPQDTPVFAAASGLAYGFLDDQGYGNHVVMTQAGGYSTVYGHMTHYVVSWGELVARGQLIGYTGSTGNSTGPHVHFEVRFAGAPVDPMPYLSGAPPEPFPLAAGWPGSAPDDPLGAG